MSWIRRVSVLAPALVLAAAGGCQSVREGADQGQRILDRPGMPPSRFFGMAGAVAGYAASAPITALLLPTYPFPDLRYRSSPERDLEMPLVFAPTEIGGGLGAFLLGGPFQPLDGVLSGGRDRPEGRHEPEGKVRPENPIQQPPGKGQPPVPDGVPAGGPPPVQDKSPPQDQPPEPGQPRAGGQPPDGAPAEKAAEPAQSEKP